MRAAFEWLGRALTPAPPDEAARVLRAQLQAIRDQTTENDLSMSRRYGILKPHA